MNEILVASIVLAAYLLDPWYRSKVVRTMSYSAHAIALLCFGILFWPSRAEKYFYVNGGIQDDNRVGGRGRVRNGKGYYQISRCESEVRECMYVVIVIYIVYV